MDIDPAPFKGRGSGVDAINAMSTTGRPGRRDGRMHNEMRPISILHSPLPQADGSARIKLGGTDVLVAIYGPIDAPINKQNADSVHIHIAHRRREGNTGPSGSSNVDIASGSEATTSRDIRQMISDILLTSLFPRKALVIGVHVLSDRGSVVSAAINATVLALIDSGVPMRSMPVAATVSVTNAALTVDPLHIEELEADAVISAAFNSAIDDEKGFVSVNTHGDCSNETLFLGAMHTCRQLAVKMRAFITLSLEQKAQRPFVWRSKA